MVVEREAIESETGDATLDSDIVYTFFTEEAPVVEIVEPSTGSLSVYEYGPARNSVIGIFDDIFLIFDTSASDRTFEVTVWKDDVFIGSDIADTTVVGDTLYVYPEGILNDLESFTSYSLLVTATDAFGVEEFFYLGLFNNGKLCLKPGVTIFESRPFRPGSNQKG